MLVDIRFDTIRKAQAGDRQALVRLVEAYQGPVYTVALAVMRNSGDAADMTQETFIRLLRSLGSYRGDGSNFTSWVHRLTVNLCLDALRRRQRSRVWSLETQTDQDDGPVRELVSTDVWEQPEWRLERSESRRELVSALARLPRSQRRALTLYYLDGKRYDEIATAMGVPLNTVKSHVLRGKDRLATLLNGRRQAGLGLVAVA
jgi:RNA polymerase sigma-70 factor (ECF subfamily)